MTATSKLADTLFPLGYAQGPAFCNRDRERAELAENILSGVHTYITGTRLYGKTSLVRQVATELGRKRAPRVHSYSVDVLTVGTIEELDALLRDAAGKLSAQFLPKNKRVLGHLGTFFQGFRPELTFRNDGVSVKLFSDKVSSATITELLEGLDQAAQHYKRRAVLIIDEFQEIAHIESSRTIEAAIRNVAKGATALSFVFLGSERSSMKLMFEDKSRPMFNSASVHMALERISAQDYRTFLVEAARMRWKKTIGDSAVDTILELTDRHTHYVNMLCRLLWRKSRMPTANAVQDTWTELLRVQRNHVQRDIGGLAGAQRSVLRAIAIESTDQPTATAYLARFKIASATMRRSLDVLKERDFVRETRSGHWEVVDPVLRNILASRGHSEPL